MVSLYVKAKEESDVVLPEGYERLEWIESTGTQWIDTGYGYDGSTSQQYSMSVYVVGNMKNTNDGMFFGSEMIGSGRMNLGYSGGNPVYEYNSSSSQTFGVSLLNKGGYSFTIYPYSNMTFLKSVLPEWSYNVTSTSYSRYSIALFASKYDEGAATKFSSARIYNCNIDVLTATGRRWVYLIPALRLSDTKPGMYDTTRGVFLENQGTGEFLYEEIGWNEVSVSDVTPISYKYELVSDDVLSQFTTVHSTSLDIPFTLGNRSALGADVNVSDYARRSWNYRVVSNGVLTDTGVMVPDACTEEGLTVHLYSNLVDAVSKIKDMTWTDYMQMMGYDTEDPETMKYLIYNSSGTGSSGISETGVIVAPNAQSFALIGIGDIGIPNNPLVEFDTKTYTQYSANADNNTIFRKHYHTSGAYEYGTEVRWWQMLPAMGVYEFFEFVSKYAGLVWNTMEYQELHKYYVLLPSLLANSEQKSTTIAVTGSGLPTRTTNPYTISTGGSVVSGQSVSITWPDAWSGERIEGVRYTELYVYKVGTADPIKSTSFHNGDKKLVFNVEPNSVYNIYLAGKRYSMYGSYDEAIPERWESSSAVIGVDTLPTYLYLNQWVTSFPNIYDLFCDLCKAFDFRFNGTSIVPAKDYYPQSGFKDISGYCSEYKSVPYPVPYKTVRINTDTVDGLWYGDEYKDRHGYPYGTKKVKTDYPISSEKDYYDFKVLKFSYCNGPYDFYTKKLVSGYERLVECVDKERKQIDMTGCLVTKWNGFDAGGNRNVWVVSSVNNDKLHYLDANGDWSGTRLTNCIAWMGSPLYVENPDELPNGISQNAMYSIDYPSVLEDPLVEPVIEVEMQLTKFLNKNGMTINDFLCDVYWYHNDLWVVYSIDSYAPDMSSATIKFQRFVKND